VCMFHVKHPRSPGHRDGRARRRPALARGGTCSTGLYAAKHRSIRLPRRAYARLAATLGCRPQPDLRGECARWHWDSTSCSTGLYAAKHRSIRLRRRAYARLAATLGCRPQPDLRGECARWHRDSTSSSDCALAPHRFGFRLPVPIASGPAFVLHAFPNLRASRRSMSSPPSAPVKHIRQRRWAPAADERIAARERQRERQRERRESRQTGAVRERVTARCLALRPHRSSTHASATALTGRDEHTAVGERGGEQGASRGRAASDSISRERLDAKLPDRTG
jgi:hypothetical protein